MFGFGGLSEVLFILFLAMLIFGPEKLPEIGRMLAKGMAEVRKASNELKRTLNAELAISEQEKEARRAQLAAVPPPPPAWSGGQTVPNLPVPAEPAAVPAGEAPTGSPTGEAPAGEAPMGVPAGEAPVGGVSVVEASVVEAPAGDAAEISEAAYLADWPEDGSAASPPPVSVHRHAEHPPASPAHPPDPVHPAAPVYPADPVVPADPLHPGGPVHPAGSAGAADSAGQAHWGSSATSHPVDSAAPASPVDPASDFLDTQGSGHHSA